MMRRLAVAAVIVGTASCYTGARATRDANRAWEGRSKAAIVSDWGKPAQVYEQDGATILRWTVERRGVRLPDGHADVSVRPGEIDWDVEFRPGEVWTRTTDVVARVDASGRIVAVRGPTLRYWNPPNDANMHWGTLFGFHAGMGRLDDTSTPLPSGGLYIGGMLARTWGLVGTFSMVSGIDDAGGAMGFAWGLGAQHWLTTRLSVRAGPAMVLAFDPGFEDAHLAPGLNGSVSYAVIKAGTFALDLRLDVTGTPSEAFGSAGVGVNLN